MKASDVREFATGQLQKLKRSDVRTTAQVKFWVGMAVGAGMVHQPESMTDSEAMTAARSEMDAEIASWFQIEGGE